MTRSALALVVVFAIALTALVFSFTRLREAAATHQSAAIQRQTSVALSSSLADLRSRPSVVIRRDDPAADAAAWLLAAAKDAEIPVGTLTARTVDGPSGSTGMSRRSVTCTADNISSRQADAVLEALRLHTPAWRVQLLTVSRSATGSDDQHNLRMSFTLETQIIPK